MKTDIHPKYFEQAKVTCACGAEFTVGSAQKELNIEICSQCHPLFTGQEKVMDTAGRMEKFKARVAATAAKTAAKKTTKK
jgi:large subunit ribosomal protein L31